MNQYLSSHIEFVCRLRSWFPFHHVCVRSVLSDLLFVADKTQTRTELMTSGTIQLINAKSKTSLCRSKRWNEHQVTHSGIV